MKPTNKVIFNTAVLYLRLIINLVIGLITTRIVLDALGETDYGIYMLVAGVISMLGILNSNMANTSMRYMAHSLGAGDNELLLRTFNTTLFLHFILGIIIIAIMEIGGWFMFEYILNIPQEKVFDARIIFHFMVITTFISVISVPFDAVMNAHENLSILSLIDVLGYILKLSAAIYLTYADANHLIQYGFLMLLIQALLRIMKQLYSKIHYKECEIRFRKYVDRVLTKSILSFTGWNLLNSVSALSIVQAKSIFLNAFFGVQINAADGIAKQLSTQINMVSVNMTNALNPQIMKSEGGGNRKRMIYLTSLGTKFSAFLYTLVAIPLFIEAPFLLNLWLRSVPDYTIIFFQIILVAATLEKFTFEITTALRAVGDIKNLQIVETSILILNMPIYYIVLKMEYPPYSIYITSILVSLVGAFVRLCFGKKIAGICIGQYFKEAVFPVVTSIVLTLPIALLPHLILKASTTRFISTLVIAFVTMISTFWTWGLNTEEKRRAIIIVNSVRNKFSSFLLNPKT